MKSAIWRDYERSTGQQGTHLRLMRCFFVDAGFRAVCYYRWAHRCLKSGWKVPARLLENWMQHHCLVRIAASAEIGPGFVVRHVGDVIVGEDVHIGPDCEIRQGVTLGGRSGRVAADGRSKPILEDNVSVGAGAKILGPITIGSGSTIGANAVVMIDVPADSIAAGVPARVIRRGGQRVPLVDRGDELAEVLKDVLHRLDRLEDPTAGNRKKGTSRPQPPAEPGG
ncbi:MAG: serine O-acetyltransferase [Phycisphaerae bacterium]|jgi:serine O-acetyltransferase